MSAVIFSAGSSTAQTIDNIAIQNAATRVIPDYPNDYTVLPSDLLRVNLITSVFSVRACVIKLEPN